MKITALEEYGLRCMLQLAAAPRGGSFTVAEIARRESLSPAYVEKLLRILSRAGLTQSQRGVKGGYALTRRPEQITLGDVERALGAAQSSQDICQRYTGNSKICVHDGDCSIHLVWQGLTQYVMEVMNGITIAQLLGKDRLVQIPMPPAASRPALHV